MDNLTHTLFALTLARTPLSRAGRGTTAALVLASNAPDVDIVTLAQGSVSYLHWHRGPTHGPLGVVGLGLLTAALVWLGRRAVDRWRARAGGASTARGSGNATFHMLVAVAIVGTLLHVAMDVPTIYGTRLLSPWDWRWFAMDLLPIVDVYLLTALVAGLAFGRRSATARRRNAAIVLALMAANYATRAVEHSRAIELTSRLFGPALAPPCEPGRPPARGPLDVWPRSPGLATPDGKRCLVEVAAIPTFSSPFRWQIIVQTSDAYEVRDIDLMDPRWRAGDGEGTAPGQRANLRYPNVWTPAVMRAAETDLGQVFLGFSRFPAAQTASDGNGATLVRWTDVRFAAGGVAIDRRRPVPNFFTATVRVGDDGRILEERLGR